MDEVFGGNEELATEEVYEEETPKDEYLNQ